MTDLPTPRSVQILLVDDSLADRGAFARLLRRAKGCLYSIAEAETIEEGLEKCRAIQPDCVVLDYHLPDADGLYFLELLAEDGEVAPFPVVMLTGSGNERVAAEAIRAGAANYIVKAQFTPTSLAHVIDQAMERVQSHRELVALRNAVLAQTEQEIEETEARWRALADLLPHGVLVVQDGVIRQANAAAATLMGYSDANGPIGHSWDYRLPANERGLIREAWDRGGSPIRVCHYLLRTDRTLVPVEQLTAAIRYHERPAHQVLLSPAEQPLGAEHDAPGTVREGQTVTQSNG